MNKVKLFLWLINLIKFDAEARFKAIAAQRNPDRGIAILDKLDAYFSDRPKRTN